MSRSGGEQAEKDRTRAAGRGEIHHFTFHNDLTMLKNDALSSPSTNVPLLGKRRPALPFTSNMLFVLIARRTCTGATPHDTYFTRVPDRSHQGLFLFCAAYHK
jgi:hypothetical protein